MRQQVLQRDEPHDDEQRAAEHLAAALDVGRNGPSDRDDEARAEPKQDGVAGGEADGHAERPRAARAGRAVAQVAVHRQRRDRHQVIGAKSVQEAQKEGGCQKQQAARLYRCPELSCNGRQSSRTPWLRMRK